MSAESTTRLPGSELRELANIDREYSSSKTSKVVGVVLLILALLVAVGATVLIATSGGPTNNALLFYGGVALGAVALGSFLLAATLLISTSSCLDKIEPEGTSFAPLLKLYKEMADVQKDALFSELVKQYRSEEDSPPGTLDFLQQCIHNTINVEFAKRCNDTDQQKDAISLAQTLVRYFPKIVGETIARQENPEFWGSSVTMMSAFYRQATMGSYYAFYKAMRDVLEVKPPEELGKLWAPLIRALYPDSRIKPPSQHKYWIKELLPYMPEALAYATILTGKINIRFAFENRNDELEKYFFCLLESGKRPQILIDMLKQEIDEDWEEVCSATNFLHMFKDSWVEKFVNDEEIFQGYLKLVKVLEDGETEEC